MQIWERELAPQDLRSPPACRRPKSFSLNDLPTWRLFARKSVALAENAHVASRVSIIEADVTLRGKARVAAGLEDEVFDHVIMNPPFNAAADRRTPDALKADAHAMTEGLFESWIRTAGAILKPGGELSLIARPESIADIVSACGKRFGGLEVTLIHPRGGEPAIRMLVSAVKGSGLALCFAARLLCIWKVRTNSRT